MRLSFITPLLGLLFGAAHLLSAVKGNTEYGELDARYNVDAPSLFERDFAHDFAARNTIEVPFAPSLRAFLEEAATSHRRALDSVYEDHLESRNYCAIHVTRADSPHVQYEIVVLDSDRISKIKNLLLTQEHVATSNYDLYNGGVLLQDGAQVGASGLHDGSTVTLQAKPRHVPKPRPRPRR
ncbi:hypothetical protein DFP72DRAFT_941960 [Ephemerocybe angulata]|uniref:Ubiquitin-like domain-containing protein n=1 Tax=Ephemerocybe angulata TaxID=980116 RepID=A0A8H6H862_9AGAR|nr:hypothetical protein DFP72DRAFT_941960 [Tulosesus angulatus]